MHGSAGRTRREQFDANYANQSLQMVWRPFRDGDDETWIMLQRAVEPFIDITDELFEQQYGAHRDALPDRMWFVETDQAVPVASNSAWWEHESPTPRDRGRIHWVVVHPRAPELRAE